MGSKRMLILIAAAGAVALLIVGARSLLQPEMTEEERLLALVQRLGHAAEQRDAKTLRSHVSERYKDDRGRDKKHISHMITVYFLRAGIINVYVVRSSVEHINEATTPMTARVSATALLTRGPRVKKLDDLLPHAARALSFDVAMEKEDDAWRAVSASWRDAGNVRDYIR